jgi:hypothetical protein
LFYTLFADQGIRLAMKSSHLRRKAQQRQLTVAVRMKA